jgi:hypothetical protein
VQLVVKGYAQEYSVDYLETFALIARFDTIRLIMVVAMQHGWYLFHLDVKLAF